MASRYSIEAVFRAIDQFTSPLSKMTRSTKTFTQSLKTDFAKAQRQVGRFGENIKRNAWMGIAALGAGIVLMAKEGVELASNLFEVQNVVDTTFGESSKSIDAWAKTAIDAFGLSELQAKQFTGTLGAAMKSSGITGKNLNVMSKDLVGLAGDFASFYNLPIEESFEKIKSGMMGQSKPLRDLGINMSVANLEAFALAQGIKKQYKNMSESEKMILRYNYLMKVSKDAQGDFSKTLNESLANQQRVLKTKFTQTLASAFQKLIPELIKVTSGFSKFLDTIDTDAIGDFILSIFNAGKTAINIFIALLKFLKPIEPLLGGIIAAFITYKIGMIAAAVATAAFNAVTAANPVGLVIIAIGILVGLIVLMVQHWQTASKWIGIVTIAFGLLSFVMFANPIGLVIAAIAALVQIIVLLVNNWKSVVTWLEKVWDWTANVGEKFTFVLGPIGALISAIIEVGKNWDEISGKFQSGDIVGGVLDIGAAILSGILAPLEGLYGILANIPGLSDYYKGEMEKIKNIRMSLTQSGRDELSKKNNPLLQAPIPPSARSAMIDREERISSGELIIKDQTGRAELKQPQNNQGYKIKLQSSAGGAH
jgi:hypothetical protein